MRSFSIPTLFAALVAFVTLFSSVRADGPLDLGKAGAYAVLAGSTVTSTGTVGTILTGDVGVFPGSAITGFPPAIINGAIATYGAAGDAQGDLTAAYNTLAGKALTATLSNQDLGGMTLIPGVYKFDETASMNGMLTLDAQGNPNAIWTFQIGSSLLIAQVAFSAEQTVSGISLDQYNINPELNEATLMTAIASTMPGVGVNNIEDFRVKAGPTSAATSVSLRGVAVTVAHVARILATDSIILNYNVVAYSALTAEQLQAQLTTAVNDGSFDTNLHSTATTNGATNLQGASSDSIETHTIEDDNSEKTLSDGAIIGIAIGGFFGLVLIAGLIYFLCGRTASK
eukprot:gene12300-14239_t